MNNECYYIAVIISLLAGCSVAVSGCPIPESPNVSCCDISGGSEPFKFGPNAISRSGVYNISNFCGDCERWAYGYCDATSGGGGWLVIQRRIQRYSTDFHKKWDDYENGFDNLNQEFWYGLRPMHCLTNTGTWELRIDLTFTNGTKTYMQYKQFSVGSVYDQYRLSVSGFVGVTPTDPFILHKLNGKPFSTVDRLNHRTCARHAHGSNSPGGWWYNSCFYINLNYNYGGNQGFISFDSGGLWHSPSFIEMKVRPATCNV